MSYIELKSVSKTYPGASKPCIHDTNITVEKGEIVVILGPSGCGKTTILKLISGLEKQDSGDIIIDGEIVNDVAPNKRPIAMVFQKSLLFKNMTVEQNVNYAPRVLGTLKGVDLDNATNEMLKLVDLEGYGDRKVNQLSGGQEQRVSLARALITKPKVLLLDEPFSALDAELRIQMRKNVRKICKDLGQTMIFVTHDQQEAVAIADKIAMIDDGRVIQCGNPEDFYTKPKTQSVAAFFGWENLIQGYFDGKEIECIFGNIPVSCDSKIGKKYLTIRPESFFESSSGYTGIVRSATFMGTKVDYEVEYMGCVIYMSLNTKTLHIVGEEITFEFDRNALWIVDICENKVNAIPEVKSKSMFSVLSDKIPRRAK